MAQTTRKIGTVSHFSCSEAVILLPKQLKNTKMTPIHFKMLAGNILKRGEKKF